MERCRPVRSYKRKEERRLIEIRVGWPLGLHENQLGEPTVTAASGSAIPPRHGENSASSSKQATEP